MGIAQIEKRGPWGFPAGPRTDALPRSAASTQDTAQAVGCAARSSPSAPAAAQGQGDRLAQITPKGAGSEVDEFHPERAYLRFDQEAQAEFRVG